MRVPVRVLGLSFPLPLSLFCRFEFVQFPFCLSCAQVYIVHSVLQMKLPCNSIHANNLFVMASVRRIYALSDTAE
ncbi:hypothetical protein BDN70DRAFT_275067 [Pholiota conissans]|uniref:Secreted protein n=1 Tax=Pholiota conissans TaxID=109636 RepID=A0A9P5YWD2_9AGAR|nr:hypothetical protein BDN70DRAFT_275067 [Pholiota conissans]